ncbi:MAG: ribose-phosphate pyrophosphokinae, partial [Gammaproteobacteria bacterium]|nr:ribose-phosphate pyrophosphokinae [Gammaproteobacteria bacterium]
PDLKIFTGNANRALAQDVAKHLNLSLGKANVTCFSDGETMVEITENVRGLESFIIQPTCAPTNDHLMELLIMADALRRSSTSNITAVIPYFGYARQDRRPRSARVPITAKVIADMISVVGIDRIITVDLHADQIQGFFHIPVDNVYATPVLLEHIRAQHFPKPLIVSPDVGGVLRARATAKLLDDCDLAIIDKRRPRTNEAEVMNIIGEVEDRNCIIVDDMIDTGGTLCQAAKALKARGAATVFAYCTHPVLSGKALENLANSALDQLVVTDTIPLREEAKHIPTIRQLSISALLAQTIRRVNNKESVSSMFTNY